jgi:hypothetical protein
MYLFNVLLLLPCAVLTSAAPQPDSYSSSLITRESQSQDNYSSSPFILTDPTIDSDQRVLTFTFQDTLLANIHLNPLYICNVEVSSFEKGDNSSSYHYDSLPQNTSLCTGSQTQSVTLIPLGDNTTFNGTFTHNVTFEGNHTTYKRYVTASFSLANVLETGSEAALNSTSQIRIDPIQVEIPPGTPSDSYKSSGKLTIDWPYFLYPSTAQS